MKVSYVAKSPSFTRALRTHEEKELKKLTKEALDTLGIDQVSTTFFDFTMPNDKYNTGIGTTFSKKGIETAKFANTYFGMTNLQVGPQGEVSDFIRSPYSGTTFSLGIQNISPEKLTTKEYGKILTTKDLNSSPYTTTVEDDESVDYKHVFSDEEGIKPLMKKAFINFENLSDDSELKQQFEQFKEDNEYWLERDSLFEALAYEYGTSDVACWDKDDQNIFADENNIDYDRIDELEETEDEDGVNVVEFNEFVQFIADKQQQETKKSLNKLGITISGDCHIGFPQKEIWAHKSAFYKDGTMFGCDRDGNGKFITCWTEAPDASKLDGEAGELYRQKFAMLMKRNNGIRIDAAWQLVYPTLVNPTQKDEDGNMRGIMAKDQPEVGAKIINILKDEAKKAGIPESKINLEMLDGAGKSWKALNNSEVKSAIKNMNCIHTMQYMGKTWGYAGHYRSKNAGAFNHSTEIAIGTHDDKPAKTLASSMTSEQIDVMSKELSINKGFFNNMKNRVNGLFAMLFTNTPKNSSDSKGRVSMTITDAVGSDRRINVPNTQKGNWEFRLGDNWEEEYFEKLADDSAFNLPQSLSMALKAKQGESELTAELDQYAHILKSDGPMTREEANGIYVE